MDSQKINCAFFDRLSVMQPLTNGVHYINFTFMSYQVKSPDSVCHSFFTVCKEKRISRLQRGQNITITDMAVKQNLSGLAKRIYAISYRFFAEATIL